jgi:hypothetical protein
MNWGLILLVWFCANPIAAFALAMGFAMTQNWVRAMTMAIAGLLGPMALLFLYSGPYMASWVVVLSIMLGLSLVLTSAVEKKWHIVLVAAGIYGSLTLGNSPLRPRRLGMSWSVMGLAVLFAPLVFAFALAELAVLTTNLLPVKRSA